jgi:hypothetical protein
LHQRYVSMKIRGFDVLRSGILRLRKVWRDMAITLNSSDDPLVLRGRTFSSAELLLIQRLVAEFREFGRTRISEEICKALDWRQPNGWLKDRACRDVLRSLENLGYVELPASRLGARAIAYSKWSPAPVELDFEVEGQRLPGQISLVLAKGTKGESYWNGLVQRYHYLGHKVSVGKNLKFLVYSGEQLVGAVSLAESSWAVAARDRALDIMGIEKREVANNNRFLIFPEVERKYLASRILGRLVRDGPREWERYYSARLRCLETFVDPEFFLGTSYRASNWVRVGQTRGYRKAGANHHNSQRPKDIYLYPIAPRLRAQLHRFAGFNEVGGR